MIIQHIDTIARQKQRDVLYVSFESGENEYEDLLARQQLIQWLENHGINWQPCGEMADTNTLMAYQGSIYIDVAFDETDLLYQRLQQFLEYPDGTMKLPGALFQYLSIAMAINNKNPAKPGFNG